MKRTAVALLLCLISLTAVKTYFNLVDSTPGHKLDVSSLFDNKKPEPIRKPRLARGEKWVPHLHLDGEVNDDSRDKLINELDQVNKEGAYAIVLEINTPGGIIDDGFSMSRAIEQSKAPVQCVVDGDAASMGFYILQSCSTRMMTSRSLLMAHEPAMGGSFFGQPDIFRLIEIRLRKMWSAMVRHNTHRMKVTPQVMIEKTAHGQEWWMDCDEAKENGAVDFIVDSVESVIKLYQQAKHPA